MGRNIHIRQSGSYDCGAACLASVALWWGINVPLSRARQECGCSQDGITIRGIIDGAQCLGLMAKALKAESFEKMDVAQKADRLRCLGATKAPVIAHTISEEGMLHYVVITKTGKRYLEIMDPAREKIKKVNINEFAKRWSGYIILVSAADGMCGEGRQDCRSAAGKRRETWHIRQSGKRARLLNLLAFHRKEILLALAGSIVLAGIGICNSLLLQMLIDEALPSGNKMLLAAISAVLAVMIPVSVLTGYIRDLYLLQGGVSIDTTLIIGFMRKVLGMNESFFTDYQKGEIEARLSDAYKIRVFICDGIVSFCVCIAAIAGVFCLMFTFYRTLALVLAGCMPVYMVLLYAADRANRKMSQRVMSASAAFENDVMDSLEGEAAIRHFCVDVSGLRFNSSFMHLARSGFKAGKISALFSALGAGLSQVIMATVVIVGGAGVIYGHLSLGELVSFYTLGAFFLSPMNSLVQFDSLMNEALVASDRLYDITSAYIPAEQNENKLMVSVSKGQPQDIVFKNVEFRYRGGKSLIENLNCTFRKGGVNLLAGPNGSGKSTVAQLIMKDLAPTGGTITYGGVDISAIHSACLRSVISIVPQYHYLFNATIFDNITMTLSKRAGSIDIEEVRKVQAACHLAGMDSFLERTEGGLSATIGQGGVRLSSGERQMVLVARMLYRDSDVMIFDEAAANLDRKSKESIAALMRKLAQMGKCVIVISHHGQMEDFADYIINLTGRS